MMTPFQLRHQERVLRVWWHGAKIRREVKYIFAQSQRL
jgi:hypothetical protein